MEDLRIARETGDERKIMEAKKEVEKAKKEVEKAKKEVEKAKKEVEKAEKEEKAIRCTASVWSQFFQKMQK